MPNLVKICIVAKSKKAAAPGVTAGDTPNDGAFGSQGGVSRLESMATLAGRFEKVLPLEGGILVGLWENIFRW